MMETFLKESGREAGSMERERNSTQTES